jgi:hypothetical protein
MTDILVDQLCDPRQKSRWLSKAALPFAQISRRDHQFTDDVANIALNIVDRVEILTLIDNLFDLLLRSTNVAGRIGLGGSQGKETSVVEAPLLES